MPGRTSAENGKKGGRPRKAPVTAVSVQLDAPPPKQPVDPVVVAEVTDNPHGLTPRELLFVEAYCGAAQFSARKAYQAVYTGCTPDSARSNGPKLLAKDRVAAAIAERMAGHVQRLRMTGDEAVDRLSLFARGNVAQLLPESHPIRQLPPDVQATLKVVRPTRYGDIVEVIDPLAATMAIAKIAGKFIERHEHSGEVSLPTRVVHEYRS